MQSKMKTLFNELNKHVKQIYLKIKFVYLNNGVARKVEVITAVISA